MDQNLNGTRETLGRLPRARKRRESRPSVHREPKPSCSWPRIWEPAPDLRLGRSDDLVQIAALSPRLVAGRLAREHPSRRAFSDYVALAGPDPLPCSKSARVG